MKIDYIEVKKFRSIDSCKISMGHINAIVGQNNSGKSALIRALNSFFNISDEAPHFFQGKHSYSAQTTPKIIIAFKDIADDAGFAPFGIRENLVVQLTYTSSSKKLVYKYKHEGRLAVVPNGLIETIQKNIAFVYIPPNRNPEQLKWEENALIKELIEEYLKIETKKRDTITPKFKTAANYLESGALNKIAKEVEYYYSLRHKFKFSLNFDKEANFLSFINGIQMVIKEAGIAHHLDDCGTGLQSLTIIAFHRVLAKLKHKNIILGLEEPETNLHPQAQRELISSIRKSSEDDGVAQVVITTHSTVIIDNIEHLHISLVRKEHDEKRGFKSTIHKLSESFFEDHGLEEFKYYQFHSYRNSDFFYANYVIFVESKNDAEVVKHLAERVDIDLDLFGISLVNIDGVKNLSYPFHIVNDLGIPFLAIVDKDYFIPYSNDELKRSRNAEGLPKYRYEYKQNIILNELIGRQRDRDRVLTFLKENHAKCMNILIKNNIICMNYNLEMDLLCSAKGVELMSAHLNLPPENSNRAFLLNERNKKIKNIGAMLTVLKDMENRNLPNSYKKIKKELLEISKKC